MSQETHTNKRTSEQAHTHARQRNETPRTGRQTRRAEASGREQLRASPTMARLLDALENGTDIGHYGRLVFAIVARRFMDEADILDLLKRQPGHDEREMAALIQQVSDHDYSPPSRERIIEWQARQDFPLLPDADDPAAGNLYRELQFPDEVYEHIEEFYEERAEAEDGVAHDTPHA